MIVFSTFCRLSKIPNFLNKSSISKLFLAKEQNAFKQVVRNMSHDGESRTFHITPSRFQYTKFKDDLHFYTCLGVIPLGLFILYVNIFIGPATLTEIPEGYEPKHWEYFHHPIKRWFARTCHNDPQINYEQMIHGLNEEKERHNWREKIEKVKILMLERDDYKGWYFVPSDQGKHYRYVRKMVDELDVSRGFR